MTTAEPLDINVIYSASSRGRRRRRAARAIAPARSSFVVLLGLLNLAAAGGHYYWTCWDVDKFVYLRLTLGTQIVVDPAFGSSFLAQDTKDSAKAPPSAPVEHTSSPRPFFADQTSRVVLWGTAYGWLTLAILATCALALSSGALFGSTCGLLWHRVGLILALVGLIGLGVAGYAIWHRFGVVYPPDYWRAFMVGPVVVCALLGLGTERGGYRFTRLAAIMLILCAVGSVVGLYLGSLCGAIRPHELAVPFLPFLALIFIAHSLWGWVLLPLASRLRP